MPNALPSPGALVTLNTKSISPPYPLGTPGGIGGAELPSYCAVIVIKAPTSSNKPLLFISPGLNAEAVALNNPVIGDVVSLFI